MHAIENKKAIEYIKSWINNYNNNVLTIPNLTWSEQIDYIKQINSMICLFNVCDVAHKIKPIDYEQDKPITLLFID